MIGNFFVEDFLLKQVEKEFCLEDWLKMVKAVTISFI